MVQVRTKGFLDSFFLFKIQLFQANIHPNSAWELFPPRLPPTPPLVCTWPSGLPGWVWKAPLIALSAKVRACNLVSSAASC